jgi:glycosyltransferase involved in cell wall biosynthesis
VAKLQRLLIVSAFFPPSRKIGGRRPERFARRLAERGWDVTVLAPDARYGLPLDDGWTPPEGLRLLRTRAFLPGNAVRRAADVLRRVLPERAHAARAAESTTASSPTATPTPARVRRGALGSMRDAFWRSVASIEFPDRWICWQPFALAAVRGQSFDVVMATLPPYTPALIARRIAQRTGAIYALDYRDPWTEAPRSDWDPALFAHLLDRHRELEDSCLRVADVVLTTSPTIGRWLAPRAGIEPVFAPNSFHARDATPRPRSKTLVYTGTLAYGRSLTPVLEAMKALEADPLGRDLSLVYAGTEGAQVVAESARVGVSDRVKNLGYVAARESKLLARDALAAVVLVTPRYEYMLPGKLFEVVSTGTPLLLIAPENADVAAICREHRLGWQHAPGDVAGIIRSLKQALAGEVPTPSAIEMLTTDHVIGRVDDELRAALARGPRGSIKPRRP